MDYLTFDELRLRSADRLPRLDSGEIDEKRCQAAIGDASAMVRTYLPSLLDENGEPVTPPARIAATLVPICVDICLYLLNDHPGEEDAEKRYERAIKLLEALAGGGNSLGSSSTSSVSGGIEPVDDGSSAIVEGTGDFLPHSI